MRLYRKARVVHDPIGKTFTVEYKKWYHLLWQEWRTYNYYTSDANYEVKLMAISENNAKNTADSLIQQSVCYEVKS